MAEGPLRAFIANWRPLLPRPKLFGQRELPEGVTREQAVEITLRSSWAQNLAAGMASKLVGLTPGTPEYEAAKDRIARRVAEGLWKY